MRRGRRREGKKKEHRFQIQVRCQMMTPVTSPLSPVEKKNRTTNVAHNFHARTSQLW